MVCEINPEARNHSRGRNNINSRGHHEPSSRRSYDDDSDSSDFSLMNNHDTLAQHHGKLQTLSNKFKYFCQQFLITHFFQGQNSQFNILEVLLGEYGIGATNSIPD